MADKTPVEICEAIALDFKKRKLTHQEVARIIGKTKSSVSNQISGKKPFSKGMAELFADAFDYSIDFLLYGKGDLRRSGYYSSTYTVSSIVADRLDPSMTPYLLEAADSLIHLANNKEVIDIWNALICGDFEQYKNQLSSYIKETPFQPISMVTAKMLCDRISKVLRSFVGAEPQFIREIMERPLSPEDTQE